MKKNSMVIKGLESKYNKNASIIDYIRYQARKNPFNTALIDSKNTLTYRDFFNSAAYVAKQLKALGLKRGDNVALFVNTSNELVIMIVAVLMIGSNYTAIDSSYPKERINYLLSNPKTALLIKDKNYSDYANASNRLISIDVLDLQFTPEEANDYVEIRVDIEGCDPAYTIYTSGSTGQPKGINISHAAVNNHMLWMKNQFKLKPWDRFLLKTPLTFDPAVWEIFLPLYIGATLVIAESGTHANPQLLREYVSRYHVTVLQLVPVILHQLLTLNKLNELSQLRYLFVGGESLAPKTKKIFFQKISGCRLVNLYGPAEATIDTTFYEVCNTEDSINNDYIGHPIYNVTVLVVNDKGQHCRAGEIGELYIAGDSLAIGYLNNTLSEQKFINLEMNDRVVRVYKTGDLVRRTHGNILEYIGRKDHQLKVNGVRIETEGLKKIILSYDNVYDCIFDVAHNQEGMYKVLICYVLPVKDAILNIEHLKSHLKNKLPDYMIPHKFYIIDKVDLSPNGKIDPSKVKKYISNSNDSSDLKDIHNDINKGLSHIWSSVLHTPMSLIHGASNFYELGGDSISSFALLSKINESFLIDMTIEQLVLNQTVESQAQYIRDKRYRGNKKTTDSILIDLNSKCETSVFLIHPIGGTTFWYLPLAKLFNKKIHLCAIQDPGISTGDTLFNSITEMADYYSECILSDAPQSKYILGGASFGTTVAIEIAKRLQKHNCVVETILALDGWGIYPKHFQNQQLFEDLMFRQQNDWRMKFNQTSIDIANFDLIFQIQRHRLKMLFDHEMKHFDNHIDIFKANEIMPVFQSIDAPDNHWGQYSSDFTITNVPGNHETMFVAPNVNILAHEIYSTLIKDQYTLKAC